MREPRQRRFRRRIVLLLILAVALVAVVRLGQVQLVQAGSYNEASRGKRAVPVVVPAVRGDIVDRNGEVLASTDERYDVQLSPKNTKVSGGVFYRATGRGLETEEITSYQAFEEIGAITGQTADEIQKIVDDALAENPKSDFAYVKRRVTLGQLNDLKELGIPWLTFASNFNRTYPNGAVAGNLIGFFGDEGVAQAGLELSQDECLAGTDGSETYERSADGVALPGSSVTTEEVSNGGDVNLTIDRDMQWQVQQIVNEAQRHYIGEWALAVVMDAKTGELLAVAEDGSVDPNNVQDSSLDRREARSFTSPYEPGSTFKTITAAAVLDQGKATTTERVIVPGIWDRNGAHFGDWYQHGDETMTFAGVIEISSNIGTAIFGERLTPDQRYDYLQKFGIGVATDVGMPLEDSGLLFPPDQWDAQTNYTTMFGQGVSSTIVQTAGVFQTIANNGVRVPPTLVKNCVLADGTVIDYPRQDEVKVISPEAAKETTAMLETVVSPEWIQEQVGIPGYRVAGKTATAEQPDGHGGYRRDFVYSFAGFFPAEDPQYVVVTSLAFPKGPGLTSGARHMWKDISAAVVRHYQVPPSSSTFESLPLS